MRLKRELQLAQDQETQGGLYHVVSRVVWRQFIFEEDEKVYFYHLMRKSEAFCGVQVQSFCLMSNHFHMLVYVPPRPEERMGDEEFFERLGIVFSGDGIDSLRWVIS